MPPIEGSGPRMHGSAPTDPVTLAETLAITLETVAELMAYRAPDLNGDPQALDVIADAFDKVAEIGLALERIAIKTAPGVATRRPRFTLVAGGDQ